MVSRSAEFLSSRVTIIHRIIPAIGKHVIAQDALSCGGKGVGIEESAYFGIIISGLEIIQPGFGVVELAVREKAGSFQGFYFLLPTAPSNIFVQTYAFRVPNIYWLQHTMVMLFKNTDVSRHLMQDALQIPDTLGSAIIQEITVVRFFEQIKAYRHDPDSVLCLTILLCQPLFEQSMTLFFVVMIEFQDVTFLRCAEVKLGTPGLEFYISVCCDVLIFKNYIFLSGQMVCKRCF